MQYSRARGRRPPLPSRSPVLKNPVKRSATLLLVLSAGLFLLLASAAQASRSCDQMRAWLHQGGGGASGLLVVDAESEQVLCASAPGQSRPLASNMKLFTTAAALSKLGPEHQIATKVFRDGRVDADGVLHGSLYLQGGGDPALGTPSFYNDYLAGLGTNLFSLTPQIRAAGIESITGRLYADDTIFDRRRGVADSGYATSSYIGPLSGLAFNSGFRGSTSASGFSSDPAKLAAKKLARSLARPASRSPPDRRAADAAQRRTGRASSAPQPRPDRQHHRRLLGQLLRRDADQAARRRIRRRRHHRRGRRRGRGLRPRQRLRRAGRRRLRPDPHQPRQRRARWSSCCWGCRRTRPAKSSSRTWPWPARRGPSPTAWKAPPPTAAAGPRPARSAASATSPATASTAAAG